MGFGKWARDLIGAAADEPFVSEESSQPAGPEQSGNPASHDDPKDNEKSQGTGSANSLKHPEASANPRTSSSPKPHDSPGSSGGSSNWTTGSESKEPNPGASKRKAIERKSPKEKDSPTSNVTSESNNEKSGASKGKEVEKKSPKEKDSPTSDVSSEFKMRAPGASIAREIPVQTGQAGSLSFSGMWPPTHDEAGQRRRRSGQGLGIFDEEEKDQYQEPHDQDNPPKLGGNKPPPFSPYDYLGKSSGQKQSLLDDPDDLYNASPRPPYRFPSVPHPDWVRDESRLTRPLDDPWFLFGGGGSASSPTLSESSIQHKPRLRVRNPIPIGMHNPFEEEQDTTEYVEHFGVNPLEGFESAGGAGPAGGTGLQGFMVDTQPQGEIKDYWADQIGPVRREHFNEFKAHTNAAISELRRVALNAARMQWTAQRDLQRQILLTEECKQRAQAAAEQAASDAGPEEPTRRDPSAPFQPWEQRRRAPLSPQYWAQKTSRGSFDSDPDNDPNVLLYENGSDQIRELTVRVMLLRSRVAWECSRRPDWSKMEHMARAAIRLAEELSYQPLVGRCFYYRGIAQYGQRRWLDAEASFEEVLACRGKYKEGMYVDAWREKVAKRLQNQGGETGGTEELETPVTAGGRESYPEFGHPPDFGTDFDSGEDREEEDIGLVQPRGGGGGSGGGGKSGKEEGQRRPSKDDGSNSSKGTDEEGFRNVTL